MEVTAGTVAPMKFQLVSGYVNSGKGADSSHRRVKGHNSNVS